MVCLYILFIRVAGLVKVFKGFRFDPELYAGFGRLVSAGGCTVTGAFERFMSVCEFFQFLCDACCCGRVLFLGVGDRLS